MTWIKQFNADYAVPLCPPGMVDTSWHNDTCPSFALLRKDDSEALRIWIEHPDVAKREHEWAPRFMVVTYGHTGTPGEVLLETSHWPIVLLVLQAVQTSAMVNL